jgi:hypothetical protein
MIIQFMGNTLSVVMPCEASFSWPKTARIVAVLDQLNDIKDAGRAL